jgi:integrase/recombinase XerC
MHRIRRAELQFKNSDVIVKQHYKVLGKRNKERIVPLLPMLQNQEISRYQEEEKHVDIINVRRVFFLTKKGDKLSDSFVVNKFVL